MTVNIFIIRPLNFCLPVVNYGIRFANLIVYRAKIFWATGSVSGEYEYRKRVVRRSLKELRRVVSRVGIHYSDQEIEDLVEALVRLTGWEIDNRPEKSSCAENAP